MTEHATFNPGFPVHIYEEGMELPKEGTYFLVSGNGLWLHKDTGIVRAFVPVSNISVLQELNAEAWVDCKLPKLPACHVFQIKTFFQKVVEKHRAEASVTLYFSKSEGKYKIHIPRQSVSHGGVHYRRLALTHLEGMKDYLRVGTIHSHCDFGAFHSGTDVGDEEDFDGIHCTFGHNDRNEFTISVSMVVNGHRWKVDPCKVLEGIDPARVESRPGGFWRRPEQTAYFTLSPVPDEKKDEWCANIEDWLKKVQAPSFFSRLKTDEIAKGDMVEWAGSMSTTSIRTTCGEGPFRVDSVDGDMIIIDTDVGLTRFHKRLLRKQVIESQQESSEVESKDETNSQDQGDR